MPLDALDDPDRDRSFPNVPRRPDGSVDPARFPRGRRHQRTPSGELVLIDVTPSADGTPLPADLDHPQED